MRWAAISFGLLALAASTGCKCCWRPYYGSTYAQPAYSQAPAYAAAPPPTYVQPAPAPPPPPQPVVQQMPVQSCQPVYCQPCVPCVPCY
jgi:hypothetical protein